MANISIRRKSSLILTQGLRFHPTEIITGLIFATLLTLIEHFPLGVNYDVSLFLETGRLILSGKTPYVDFAEINFPLVMYLHTIPVGIAQVLGVNPIPVFSLLVFALAVASYLGLRCVLIQQYKDSVPSALRLFSLMIVLYSLYLFLAQQFGQREHLFMLLFLPAFALRWQRWQGGSRVNSRLALLLGLAAGVGAALKPQFLPIAFAPEAYWIAAAIWTRRQSAFAAIRQALLTPEVAGFVLFGAFYALALLLATTMRQAFFAQVFPYVTSSYYNYDSGPSPISLLLRQDMILLWMALLLTLPLVLRNRPLARPLFIMTLAAIVVYCLQDKGWYYQRIPVIIGVSGLAVMLLVEQVRPLLWSALLKTLLALITIVIVMTGGLWQLQAAPGGLRDTILKYTHPNDPVLIMQSFVSGALPLLVQTNRVPAGRELSGVPIGDHPAQDHDLTDYIVSMAQVIKTSKPPLILIDATHLCARCASNSSMFQYLNQIGFVQTQILPGYTDEGTIDQFEVYARK